jgi:hypothetical protein
MAQSERESFVREERKEEEMYVEIGKLRMDLQQKEVSAF